MSTIHDEAVLAYIRRPLQPKHDAVLVLLNFSRAALDMRLPVVTNKLQDALTGELVVAENNHITLPPFAVRVLTGHF